MMHYLYENNNSNNSIFLIKSHEDQKELSQHCSNSERKKFPALSSITSETIPQKGRENKDIFK